MITRPMTLFTNHIAWSSHTENTKENFLTKIQINMATALLPMYKGTLSLFGGTTEFLVADVKTIG